MIPTLRPFSPITMSEAKVGLQAWVLTTNKLGGFRKLPTKETLFFEGNNHMLYDMNELFVL